jgi:uroporphyrinogen-III synthase
VRGADISTDLREILKKSGIFIGEIVAYAAHPIEKLSHSLLKSLDNREFEAVMLFSARGGAHFAALMEQYDRAVRLKQTKALCLSEAVLQSVSVLPFQKALVAGTPDRHGMLELIETISVKVE